MTAVMGARKVAEDNQREEHESGDEQHDGGDHGGEALEDEARDDHHKEGDHTSGRGEVTHEGRVVVGVRELRLDLTLPRHLHQVDAHAIRHNRGRQVADVRRLGQEGHGLSHRPLSAHHPRTTLSLSS